MAKDCYAGMHKYTSHLPNCQALLFFLACGLVMMPFGIQTNVIDSLSRLPSHTAVAPAVGGPVCLQLMRPHRRGHGQC